MHQFQVRAVNSTGAGPASKSVKVALMQVSYSAETYEAVEPNPEGTTEGLPAQVTVRLTPAADRRVSIPITVTEGAAESGDYTVSGLGSGNLLDFVGGDNSKRFTIEAESDTEMESGEKLELGFGAALPVGVRSGTPSTATVTLSRIRNPGYDTANPGSGPCRQFNSSGADPGGMGRVDGYDGERVYAALPDHPSRGRGTAMAIRSGLLGRLPGTCVRCRPWGSMRRISHMRVCRRGDAIRYQVQATNPHGDSEWSESFPPSGVTPVPNKAAAAYLSVEPLAHLSEPSSEESASNWEDGVHRLGLPAPALRAGGVRAVIRHCPDGARFRGSG